MNGTRISSTFEGRWVNTIVRTSPKRAASGTAASADNAARMLAPNRIAAERRRIDPEPAVEPERDEPLA